MQKINIDTWSRKQQYLFYKDFDVPTYHLTVTLDITHFKAFIKTKGHPFYFAFMHVMMRVMNDMEAMRCRFVDGDAYLMDKVHPSFTDLIAGTENFKIVTVDHHDDLKTFIGHARDASTAQGEQFIDMAKESRQDLVYITTVPWYAFTQVTHAHMLNNKDAIPRIVWGKATERDGIWTMPFALEVHHAFVDGYQVGHFLERLQQALNRL